MRLLYVPVEVAPYLCYTAAVKPTVNLQALWGLGHRSRIQVHAG